MTASARQFSVEKPLASRLAILLALLAFVFQGYAVQTHVHGKPLAAASHEIHVSAPSQPAPDDPYDPANCPLCQEMLHAGVFIAPAPVSFAVLLGAVSFIPVFHTATLTRQAPQHGWQSRAPPRH